MAKKKRQQRSTHRPGASFHQSGGADPRDTASPEDVIAATLHLATMALQSDDLRTFDDHVAFLAASCDRTETRVPVVKQVRRSFDELLHHAWQSGWQPADVHRLVFRRTDKSVADFSVHVIVAQLRRYAADTVHPSWRSQLTALAEGPLPQGDPITAAHASGVGWLTVMECAVRCLHVFRILPPIEKIGPAPGEWVRPAASAEPDADVDERILTRVRMLLAKAESTPYEAEAETFTAGAASLIARHRISETMLAASRQDGPKDGTSAQRIGIDNPYEQPKVQLLNAVAEANSCRVVWSKELGFATVVGFPSDLSGVELLYTSLLLQATNTMTAAGKRSVQGAHKRSRTFRSSFLTSFAIRIGERLQETTEAEERSAAANFAGAPAGERLPALIERDQDVAEATKKLFPQVVSTRARRTIDADGWVHGRRAADDADVRARVELRRSS